MHAYAPVAEVGASKGETPLKLAVLVLYEDLKTGLRARQILDRTVQGLKANVDLEVNLWRLDLLREPALRRQADIEAAKADILFVSAHGKGELPRTFSSWLEEWFRSRAGEPSALALSLDADRKVSSGTTHKVEALGAAARRAGVDLFLHSETDLESRLEVLDSSTKMNVGLTHGVPQTRSISPLGH